MTQQPSRPLAPSPVQPDDTFYMDMALELARAGWGHVSPNPLVGAVVVRDGQVVGRGWHRAYGQAHAEVNALADAGEAARGATIYVTLEPCNHWGRTPPCTKGILEAGIGRVVAAMADPNPGVAGGGNAFLLEHGIPVTCGVREAEARRLIEFFVTFITTRRPFVILKSAATLDGRIATRTGDSRWVTGEESRAHVHWLRHGVDAILVGVGTVLADNPSLTTRLPQGGGRDPLRVILDSRLSTPPNATILTQSSDAPTWIAAGPDASLPEAKERRAALERAGAVILDLPASTSGSVDLDALLVQLGERRITSLLVEGGGRVMQSFLRDGLGNKMMMFYAPRILGGDDGISICRGQGPERMSEAVRLEEVTTRRFGPDILVEGYFSGRSAGPGK